MRINTSPSCFPIISYLHVPGKMSEPLWLMMGTAFRIEPPSVPSTHRLLLLTAKHTFLPWDYTKDGSKMKIPEEYRKPRFVMPRLFDVSAADGRRRAVAASFAELSIVAVHPDCDVALLSASVPAAAAEDGPKHNAVHAVDASRPMAMCSTPHPPGTTAAFVGYRGEGKLGEFDTLDPSLLETLSSTEREELIASMKDVRGKQVLTKTHVEVVDPVKGLCRGIGRSNKCFHGMSGSPLMVQGSHEGSEATVCAGVLYGMHPQSTEMIGFTPCADFEEWLKTTCSRL